MHGVGDPWQGRFLHEISDTPLLKAVLSSLLQDQAPLAFVVAARGIIMLMPCMASKLGPYLPSLWPVFIRGLRWQILAESTSVPDTPVAAGAEERAAEPRPSAATPSAETSEPPASSPSVLTKDIPPSPRAGQAASQPVSPRAASAAAKLTKAPPPGERGEGWDVLGSDGGLVMGLRWPRAFCSQTRLWCLARLVRGPRPQWKRTRCWTRPACGR